MKKFKKTKSFRVISVIMSILLFGLTLTGCSEFEQSLLEYQQAQQALNAGEAIESIAEDYTEVDLEDEIQEILEDDQYLEVTQEYAESYEEALEEANESSVEESTELVEEAAELIEESAESLEESSNEALEESTETIEETKEKEDSKSKKDSKNKKDSKSKKDTKVQEESKIKVTEDGTYDSKDEVALYLHTYHHLPSNYVTKTKAKKAGWNGGSLEDYFPGGCIGGGGFGNNEGILPDDKDYRECDIDTMGKKSRGAKRIVYSDDGYIYYTDDHYESFECLYEGWD